MAKKKTRATKEPQRSSARADFVAQLEEWAHYPWVYAGALLLFTVILFNKFIFSDMMLAGSDTIQAGVFFRSFMIEHFKQFGSMPMWNPYIFCGMPFVDAFHGDIFYLPTFILKLILPLHRALGWGLVIHIYFAGIFAYLCARGFGLSRLAASLAGICYMFSSYLVSLVAPGHDGKIFVTTLFPLAFHLLNRGTITYKLKYFILLGLVIALIILTPHPQMAYFSLWALGGFLIFKLVFMLRDKQGAGRTGLVLGMFILAVVIGLFGSAIQFYPGYKYISEFSPRADGGAEGRGGYDWATSWSLHTEELVGQVIPGFAGVSNQSAGTQYWGKNAFKDNSEYAGFMPLLLGIIGFALWRKRESWFFLGLAVFALIYALGATTPFFRLFFHLIPNVSKMRAPSMIMFLFAFSFSLLAAFAVDALRKMRSESGTERRRKLTRALLVVATALTVLALLFSAAGGSLMNTYSSIFYNNISQSHLDEMKAEYRVLSVQPVAPGELESLQQQINIGESKRAAMLAHIPNITISLWVIAVLTWLTLALLLGFVGRKIGAAALVGLAFLALIDLWRLDFSFVEVAEYDRYFPKAPVVNTIKGEPEPVRVFDLTRRTFSSKDYFALQGIEQMIGYHGAQLKTFDEFIGGLDFSRLMGPRGIELRAFQLTGTKYVILDQGRKLDKSFGLQLVYDNEVAVFETPNAMRRAALYHAYQIGAGDTTDLNLLYSENFPFRQILLLNEEPQYQPVLPDSGASERVEIITHEVNYQKYRAELATPGLLFVSENFFPGCETVPLLRADYTFRAVSLPAGSHEIEFSFEWPRYDMSKLVTMLTIIGSVLVLAGCLVWEKRRKGTNT
jgi:hypothetical protein